MDSSHFSRSASLNVRIRANHAIAYNASETAGDSSRSAAIVANQLSSPKPKVKQSGLMPLPPSQGPVVEVDAWKPTILVVDDSPMNRKVDACLLILSHHPLTHNSPLPPSPSLLAHAQPLT